jgi:CheY-like chemotaxis protein
MPVMDGWNFLKEFTALKPPKSLSTTLYIVSSSIDAYEIERAKSFELVTDYLIKPLNLEEFEGIFNRAIA